MFRLSASIACILQAFVAIERAIGAAPQTLFSGAAVDLWWLIALYWAAAGLFILFRGIK